MAQSLVIFRIFKKLPADLAFEEIFLLTDCLS